jgi:OOP family OmpA-OmpF porin
VPVDAVGCALIKERIILEGANFAFDSAEILPKGYPVLDETAASLKDHPDVRIEIGGYADFRGSVAYNIKLSQRRADAVKNYLVSKGVRADRMVTKAYGKSSPIATNKTEAGMAENRRVEIKVISK